MFSSVAAFLEALSAPLVCIVAVIVLWHTLVHSKGHRRITRVTIALGAITLFALGLTVHTSAPSTALALTIFTIVFCASGATLAVLERRAKRNGEDTR